MAFDVDARNGLHGAARKHGGEFKLFFAIAFLVFLLPTILSRLLSLLHGSGDGARPRPSIIDEASARADKIVPFLFMG